MTLQDITEEIRNTWPLQEDERRHYPEIVIIAAIGRKDGKHNILGKDNELPWNFRDFQRDMNRFKELTTGHFVLMGRKTFESIGSRPLPKRTNLIVTSKKEFPPSDKPISYHSSIESALKLYKETGFKKKLFVIGGQTLYEQMMPIATEMLLTHIDRDVDGDTFFPEFQLNEEPIYEKDKYLYWTINNEEKEYTDGVRFVDYRRSFSFLI